MPAGQRAAAHLVVRLLAKAAVHVCTCWGGVDLEQQEEAPRSSVDALKQQQRQSLYPPPCTFPMLPVPPCETQTGTLCICLARLCVAFHATRPVTPFARISHKLRPKSAVLLSHDAPPWTTCKVDCSNWRQVGLGDGCASAAARVLAAALCREGVTDTTTTWSVRIRM